MQLGQTNRTKRILLRRLKESWQWWLLLLPAFVYVCIFAYGPMYGLQIAFRNYRPRQGMYSLATFPCAILFALMLNEVYQVKLKKSMQMITYAPHFMSEVVVCSLVWMMLDRANGPINNLIAALGGERIAFMTDPASFPSIYVWSGVWQNLGWGAILYLSALSAVSAEIIEAAKIDGASRFQVMMRINLPRWQKFRQGER